LIARFLIARFLIARFLIARFLIARFRHLLRTCCAPAAHLLRTCGHEHFAGWQAAAHASAVPELRGFVASLQRDEDAVRAALTEELKTGTADRSRGR
jgi:hypothetical protein